MAKQVAKYRKNNLNTKLLTCENQECSYLGERKKGEWDQSGYTEGSISIRDGLFLKLNDDG